MEFYDESYLDNNELKDIAGDFIWLLEKTHDENTIVDFITEAQAMFPMRREDVRELLENIFQTRTGEQLPPFFGYSSDYPDIS